VDATGHVTLVELSIGRRVQSTHLARLHFLDLKDSRVEKEKANYLLRYYGPLMTMHERQAYSDLLGAAKMSNGITDAAALEAFRNSTRRWRSVSADNPQVLRLASEGLEAFVQRTAQRILDEYKEHIVFNECPRCGALLRTPRARQCRFCKIQWD
jgi:hypothetical protein